MRRAQSLGSVAFPPGFPMGLSLTPVTHVSASPPFHPGRSVLPSPVGDNSLSSETLPLQPETQVLAHIRPWTNWFDL